jgi:D-alanine transaminase
MMKQYAVDRSASETVMLRDGFLTEGSSTNTMLVSRGTLVAPRKSVQILPGITYDAAIEIARAHGMPLELRPVPEAELRAADEIWLSSSGREVLAITSLDGSPVGNGRPGPAYRRMAEWFQQAKRADSARWLAERAARKLAA